MGADLVSGLLAGSLPKIGAEMTVEPVQINGYPALLLRRGGEIDTVMAVRIDDGLITGLYAVRNPEKLTHMQRETALRR
ncbi:hypothetical protein OHB12_34040 [Nocardia sp. NBC_01730]|uniref:hypothetical protein n=1 Tax=Nocardia sp. NBC_01730 TaxID=2975998 RepID=UPI002E0FC042|nr:hypothetical protein OHB12_34040 [Nocardia sp. NBC_01730]